MSARACTLVLLCVSLTLVSGLPVTRRLPLSPDRDDVLAGSDFLSVFMRRNDRLRTADRPGPFEPHQYDRDINSVSHKSTLLDLVKPFPNKYTFTDILKSTKYGYNVDGLPTEGESYQATVPDVFPTHETEIKTTTPFIEPTTTEEVTSVEPTTYAKMSGFSMDDQQTTVFSSDEPSSQPETTTHKVIAEKIEEKIISVRVSSSVARHSHRTIETSTTKTISEIGSQKHINENFVSTLVTQEQPPIHAVQRSDFAVEEAPLIHSETNDHQEPLRRQEEVQGNVQEVTRFGNERQRNTNGKLPVFEIHYHNPPAALISNYDNKPEARSREIEPVQHFRRKEFRQLSPYAHQEPTSYHTRVISPTSDSSVNFYRQHRRNYGAAETVQQPVLAEPYPPSAYRRDEDKSEEPPQETSTYHEEPRERSYAEPEKVYGQPEQNYEVDEAVSVITNGKAHGVQESSSPPSASDQEAQNKFGYVVEGRNFRKYRVEERTPDGFIVGEYGVVSHDDGSLRGVRYTADSTINPRLIYDTLVKFLSL